jgi:hypothetical protein
MKGIFLRFTLLVFLLFPAGLLYQCKEDLYMDEIPIVYVEETINLNNFDLFISMKGYGESLFTGKQLIDIWLSNAIVPINPWMTVLW